MEQSLGPQVFLVEFGLHQIDVGQNVLARHDRMRLVQPFCLHPGILPGELRLVAASQDGIEAALMEAGAASGGDIVPAKRDRVRRHEALHRCQDLLPCALVAHRPVDQLNQRPLRVSWRFGVWPDGPHDRPPRVHAVPPERTNKRIVVLCISI